MNRPTMIETLRWMSIFAIICALALALWHGVSLTTSPSVKTGYVLLMKSRQVPALSLSSGSHGLGYRLSDPRPVPYPEGWL